MKEKLTPQYNDAVKQIKTAILQSQAKALASVNQEQLALYFGIGRYISQNSRSGFWGKDAIETISRQLSSEMPGLRGFSSRNLRNMRMFYEQWEHLDSNLAVTTAKLQLSNNENNTIRQLQLTNYDNFPISAFFGIGFTHHCAILSGVKTLQERIFYIQLCFNQSLTVEGIQQRISEDAYHNQGKMTNNFVNTMPDYKQAFRAIQMFKDSYLLDYINTEQLGQREEDIDERVIVILDNYPTTSTSWMMKKDLKVRILPLASSYVKTQTRPLWNMSFRITNGQWASPLIKPVRKS